MTKNIIELEITLNCNFNCPCCNRLCDKKKNNTSSDMNISDVQNILYNINKYSDKIDYITIIGGEPTVHPNFLNICKYIKSNTNINIEVSTNGSNDNIYKKEVEKLGIKYYTYNNDNTIDKKIRSHVNMYLSPYEEKCQIKSDCGLNCGISICKINNKIYYAYCANQKMIAIMLNRYDLLYTSLDNIMNDDMYNNELTNNVCKHCQFMNIKRVKYKDNKNISECFKEGLCKYENRD